MNVHLETALIAHRLGYSPLPPKEDGSKAPLADVRDNGEWTWTPYQSVPATEEHIRGWYARNRTGNGLACGVGNLECTEFDCPVTHSDFLAAAQATGLGELVGRIRTGYEESTPGGGFHWLYRCADVKGNTELAKRHKTETEFTDKDREAIATAAALGKDHKPVKVLIETRGQGGFVITAPSNGNVHPSGGAYKLVRGGLKAIATITTEERNALWDLARTFDQMPVEPKKTIWNDTKAHEFKGGKFPDQGKSVGDDYNERAPLADILEPHGWVKVHTRGSVEYWRRPGKDKGTSATWGYCKGFKVFTSSTQLTKGETYSKFGLYTALNHGGDFTEAVKVLAKDGFGTWIDNNGTEKQNPPPKDWKRTTSGGATINEAGDDPHRLGRIYLSQQPRIIWHRDEFHIWENSAYRPMPDREVNLGTAAVAKQEFDRSNPIEVQAWEDRGRTNEWTKRPCGRPTVRKVGNRLIGDINLAVGSMTMISGRIEPPAWLIDNPPFPATDILPTLNALVHLPSYVEGKPGAITKPTSDFFCP